MLKKTKSEETVRFFVTFLSLVTYQLMRGQAPCPPFGYAYGHISSTDTYVTLYLPIGETI